MAWRTGTAGSGTASAGAALAMSGLGLPKFFEAEAAGVDLTPGVPQGISSYVTMGTLPGKKPLIQLADKPPNYESPLEYFSTPITPNNEFFVRYHLADIPDVDVKTYTDFSSASTATSPVSNGQFDSTKMAYTPGGPGCIVKVSLYYQWPIYVSLLGNNLANLNGNKRLLVATSVFRNEPYGGSNAC